MCGIQVNNENEILSIFLRSIRSSYSYFSAPPGKINITYLIEIGKDFYMNEDNEIMRMNHTTISYCYYSHSVKMKI